VAINAVAVKAVALASAAMDDERLRFIENSFGNNGYNS
jgi:hypothetical protein